MLFDCQCGNSYLDLANDIGEAANFATYFTASPAAESTPHLYISALATWSQNTNLSQNWKSQFTRIPVFTYAQSNIHFPLMTVTTAMPIECVMFSSDGKQIVSGSSDNSVQVWDASTGMQLMKLKGHTSSVSSVAFSANDTWIVSGSFDGSVLVWDTSTGEKLKELKGHTASVESVAFSRDGTQIVSGSYDHSVRVWDVLAGLELMNLYGHCGAVFSVAFSSDSMWIVSGSEDCSVQMWDASTGAKLRAEGPHWYGQISHVFK